MDISLAELGCILSSTGKPWKRKEIEPTCLDRLPFLVKALIVVGWGWLVIKLCSLWLGF